MFCKLQTFVLIVAVLCQQTHAIRKKSKLALGEPEATDAYLPICAKEIVRETCTFLRGGLTKDNAADAFQYLRLDTIKEILSASEDSIVGLWKTLGLPPMPRGDVLKIASEEFKSKLEEYGLKILTNGDDVELNIGCEQVCYLVRDYVRKNHVLPPSSDKMCQVKNGEVVCDIDVRPESLAQLHRTGDSHARHEQEVEQPDPKTIVRKANESLPEPSDYSVIDYVAYEIIEGVAELFRFYPLLDPSREPVASPSLLELGSSSGEQVSSTYYDHAKAVALGKKAIAYVNRVKVKLELAETKTHLSEWFGAGDSTVKTEVLRVLNSVVHVLKNVHYEYPGPKCGATTYAYVYPRGYDNCDAFKRQQTNTYCRTNEQKKFIYFLCDVYVNGDDGAKIETLVHEGSHHHYAYTDDVCSERDHVYGVSPTKDCDTAYGRSTCAKMAKYDKVRAIKNADSHCYFVQAVADPHYHNSKRCKKSTNAIAPYADDGDDCMCSSYQKCYQGGSEGCRCSAGARCLQYFSHTCTNCKCGYSHLTPSSTSAKCHSSAEADTPDHWGDCKCPDDKKCYTGSSTIPGCSASSVVTSSKSPTYFLATCTNCVCKAPPANSTIPSTPSSSSCPASALHPKPDSDGDCECDTTRGIRCSKNGDDCPFSGGFSARYFKSSCSSCSCALGGSGGSGGGGGSGGSGPPVAGQCPSFAKDSTPDNRGDCRCPSGKLCYQGSSVECLTSSSSLSRYFFASSCVSCKCKTPSAGANSVPADDYDEEDDRDNSAHVWKLPAVVMLMTMLVLEW